MIAHPWIFGRDRREDKRKIAALSRSALEARTTANAARDSSS